GGGNGGGGGGGRAPTGPRPAHTGLGGPPGAGGGPSERKGRPSPAEGATCPKRVEAAPAGSANASVQSPFTVKVREPLAGAFAIENTVTSSNGTCPTCTVVNPTISELVTTKAITTVTPKGKPSEAANAQTQIT